MSDALNSINALSPDAARETLLKCCGSKRWATLMAAARPFLSLSHMIETSEAVFPKLLPADWLEAFSHHPKIGDAQSLRAKFATTRHWASGEQAGVNAASEQVIADLADGNRRYEEKFGFIFIVCATGKSADAMLGLLKERLDNGPAEELLIAAAEQKKITTLRLEKLLSQ
jgi:2-oxo-4-hydroxy-4-carboxy-5-ureidoimidazoline decarboxylase